MRRYQWGGWLVLCVGCAAADVGTRREAANALRTDAPSLADTSMHAQHHPSMIGTADTAFAALQQRGARVMGVDQYASVHQFEPLPDGGRIVLEYTGGDTVAVARIQAHLQGLATAFSRGDFAQPMATHAMDVPGTALMGSLGAAIAYEYRPRAMGGEVRLKTSDRTGVQAIHLFLGFQAAEHSPVASGRPA